MQTEPQLTCCDDVEEARGLLLADAVRGRAEEGAVVQLRHGLVGHDGRGAVPGDVAGRHIDTLGRVVERPFELDVRGVRVHHALDLCRLVLGDAVDTRLVGRTGGCIWNDRQGGR